MEQERYEEGTTNILDKCRSVPYDEKKSNTSSLDSIQSAETAEKHDSVNFASPTPEKKIYPSRSKNKGTTSLPRAVKQLSESYQNESGAVDDEAVELLDDLSENEGVELLDDLIEDEEVEPSHGTTEEVEPRDEEAEVPDKYKTLAELFDRIDTSVRLLNMRKKLPTFQNICTVVEVMTKRKLSCKHLAQIKYIVPEAIQIEKILVHDEKTLCMVPDMKVTLQVDLDVIEVRSCQSPFMALRRAFRSKLLEFSNSNPEGVDIPEAILPEPFTKRDHTVLSVPLPTGSSVDPHSARAEDSHTALVESEPPLISSFLSQSIRRCFSQKKIVPETEKTQLLASLNNPLPANSSDVTKEDTKRQQEEEHSSLVSESTVVGSPAALVFSPRCSINSSACQSSPGEALSVPHSLIVETPAQPTPPKRTTLLRSDDKMNTEPKALSQAAAKRSLDFSPLKGGKSASTSTADESQQFTDNSFQSINEESSC